MPGPVIALDLGQAEDLHELLDHAETIAQWLLHAADEIPGDLAQTAYPCPLPPAQRCLLAHRGPRPHPVPAAQNPPPRRPQRRPGPRRRHPRQARRTGRNKHNDLSPRRA